MSDEMAKALKPFADHAKYYTDKPDEYRAHPEVCVRDLRAAQAALAAQQNSPSGDCREQPFTEGAGAAEVASPSPLGGLEKEVEHIATINLLSRPDGGLRVYSVDIVGLVLSGPDPQKIMASVLPALAALRSASRRTGEK